MKRFVVLALATCTLALIASGTAGARGTALTPAERALQKQVNALSKQVTALQKTVKAQTKSINEAGNLAEAGVLLTTCSNVITADEFQGTWKIVDTLAAATQAGKTYFGTQTPVDDKSLCTSAFGVARPSVSPPNVTPYSQLIGLVTGSAATLSKRVVL